MNESRFDATGVSIDVGTHICAMYNGSRERDNVLLPFLSDGLLRGDKCFAAVHEPNSADLTAKVGRHVGVGFDVPASIASRQFEIRTEAEPVLTKEKFDPSVIVDFWDSNVSAAIDRGFDFVRLTAEARWWMPQLPSIEDLIRYESELNRYTPKHPQAVLCLYDLSQYNEAIVIDLLKTHPRVLLSGMSIDNPYYLTPDEFLAQRSAR